MGSRSLSSTTGSLLDMVGTTGDVITNSMEMVNDIIQSGRSYTTAWRETAKHRSTISISEAADVAVAEASERHMERMSYVKKLSESDAKVYGDYAQKLHNLLKSS